MLKLTQITEEEIGSLINSKFDINKLRPLEIEGTIYLLPKNVKYQKQCRLFQFQQHAKNAQSGASKSFSVAKYGSIEAALDAASEYAKIALVPVLTKADIAKGVIIDTRKRGNYTQYYVQVSGFIKGTEVLRKIYLGSAPTGKELPSRVLSTGLAIGRAFREEAYNLYIKMITEMQTKE